MTNDQLKFKTPNDLYNGDTYVGALYSSAEGGYRFYLAGFGSLLMYADIDADDLKKAQAIVLGIIQFDHEQEVFVYWPKDIDDGVSYFYSLTDTEQLIAEELGFDNFQILH